MDIPETISLNLLIFGSVNLNDEENKALFKSVQTFIIKSKRLTGWWFSPGTLVSSTNKSDHHDIAEILLKVALNTLNQTKPIKKTAESIEKSKNLLFDLALVISTL